MVASCSASTTSASRRRVEWRSSVPRCRSRSSTTAISMPRISRPSRANSASRSVAEVLNPGHLVPRRPVVLPECRLDDDLRTELVRYHNVWRLIKAVQALHSLGLWTRHDRGDLRSAPGRLSHCPPLQAIDLLPGEHRAERRERPVPCTHSSRGRAGSSSTALPWSSPAVLVGERARSARPCRVRVPGGNLSGGGHSASP